MTSRGSSSRFQPGPLLGPEGLETGARHTHFWKAAVEKEVVQRAYHKPALIAEAVSEWEKNGDQSPFGKEADHGLVYCTLHDLHRAKAGGFARSRSDVKLPSVPRRIAPVPMGGLWRWPGGPPLPADVESVITATTACSIPPSVLSVLTRSSQVLPKSSRLTPFPPQELPSAKQSR
eukprot:Skav202915  [mRNA]  locus=scaffold1565:96381:103101:- [translate_table: standard]